MRVLHNRRSLSPIFAALVMLGVITILFIPIFLWASGLTSGTRSFWELSGLIATERIVIEEVNFKGGTTSCTIYVRNIGKTLVTISEVVISEGDSGRSRLYEKSKSQFTTKNPVTSVIISSINQGDLMKIDISTLGFSPIEDTTYVVKVFTERGVGDTYQVKA